MIKKTPYADFQNRFQSETVETEAYLLSVLRYIHPVKAKLVAIPEEYEWSSCQEELWEHRDDIVAGQSSGQLGRLKEDKNKTKEANLPWLWSYKGQKWLADPAGLLRLLAKENRYTTKYIYNPYLNN